MNFCTLCYRFSSFSWQHDYFRAFWCRVRCLSFTGKSWHNENKVPKETWLFNSWKWSRYFSKIWCHRNDIYVLSFSCIITNIIRKNLFLVAREKRRQRLEAYLNHLMQIENCRNHPEMVCIWSLWMWHY